MRSYLYIGAAARLLFYILWEKNYLKKSCTFFEDLLPYKTLEPYFLSGACVLLISKF
jgi:hypothetical protein